MPTTNKQHSDFYWNKYFIYLIAFFFQIEFSSAQRFHRTRHWNVCTASVPQRHKILKHTQTWRWSRNIMLCHNLSISSQWTAFSIELWFVSVLNFDLRCDMIFDLAIFRFNAKKRFFFSNKKRIEKEMFEWFKIYLPVHKWSNLNQFWLFTIQKPIGIRHVEYIDFR